MTAEERPAIQALCQALDGHPLGLLQCVNNALAGGADLAALNAEAIPAGLLDSATEPEKRLLAVLALLGGAPAQAALLAAITALPDAEAVLARMAKKHWVQAQDRGYRLAGNLVALVRQSADLTPWGEKALACYTDWAEQRRSAPEEILREAEAIRRLLEWASETGRQAESLRLAKALEGAVSRRKRWGAWAWTLSFLTSAGAGRQ